MIKRKRGLGEETHAYEGEGCKVKREARKTWLVGCGYTGFRMIRRDWA